MKCGAEGKTQYAFKRHPAPYTRNRRDYIEVCIPCHVAMDNRGNFPGNLNRNKTHCDNGHELSGENLRIYRQGKRGTIRRVCVECKKAENKRAYEKRAA